MRRQDWSPGSRKRGEVLIRIRQNLGDASPFDYGGFIVYEVVDTTKRLPESWVQAEFWHEPTEEESERYQVYRFPIQPNVLQELDWVDWDAVAASMGTPVEEIRRDAASSDPIRRALVYGAVGGHYGWENIDPYPELYTRQQMEERWPEFA